MHLTDAPELRGLVLDQLKDALGPDYIEELTDFTVPSIEAKYVDVVG